MLGRERKMNKPADKPSGFLQAIPELELFGRRARTAHGRTDLFVSIASLFPERTPVTHNI